MTKPSLPGSTGSASARTSASLTGRPAGDALSGRSAAKTDPAHRTTAPPLLIGVPTTHLSSVRA